jgi:serine/threonine-protein kinase
MAPGTSPAICALCHRNHDPERPCSTAAGDDAGRIGELLGERYELVRLLGAGGMGAVYEARHKLIGRRFAVKLLHPEYAQQPSMLTRFQREARAAGSLENDHIAAVTDFGFAADGAPYLVMEHLDGQDLAALLEQTGPLPVARAVSFVIQACRGLYAAHAHDIVHRDLKPANLFLTRRGDGSDLVKVLDFGIAKLLDADETGASITGTGKLLGTACYMPPEQAKGESDLDHRIDIYALGAILYELLAATKAHPGTNYNAVLFHILTQKPDPLGLRRTDLPAGLEAVIERAMAYDRADRHESVAALMTALAPFAAADARTSAPVAVPTRPRSAPAAETVVTPATAAAASVPRPVTAPAGVRRRAPLWLGLGLAAIALAIGAFVMLRGRAPVTPSSAAPSVAVVAPPPPAPPPPAVPPPAAVAPPPAAVAPPPAAVAPPPAAAAPPPAAAAPPRAPSVPPPRAEPPPAPPNPAANAAPARSKSSRRHAHTQNAVAGAPPPAAPPHAGPADDFDTRNPYDE